MFVRCSSASCSVLSSTRSTLLDVEKDEDVLARNLVVWNGAVVVYCGTVADGIRKDSTLLDAFRLVFVAVHANDDAVKDLCPRFWKEEHSRTAANLISQDENSGRLLCRVVLGISIMGRCCCWSLE